MPVLASGAPVPGVPLRPAHAATILPGLLRRVDLPPPRRVRIETPDGDFLDIDEHRAGSRPARRAAIVSHGLEGHSRRAYVLGMARMLLSRGFDVYCWNMRGCSGEPNRTVRFYHSGQTDDLHRVVAHALDAGHAGLALVGFSLGGNQILKYLGEAPDRVPAEISGAVAVSTPCDLAACQRVLDAGSLRPYTRYFLAPLKAKIRTMARLHPARIRADGLWRIQTLKAFDDRYTAPLHGFADADDYYAKGSCNRFLRAVAVPALLMNAKDDPFLPPTCYPTLAAEASASLHLEMPEHGGHCGFLARPGDRFSWAELRAGAFLA